MELRIRNLQPVIAAAVLALAACSSRLEAPRDFRVFFETDRAELTAEAQQIVIQIAADARQFKPSKIVVAGRADGGTAHDAALADARATAVMRALADRGIPSSSLEKQADAPPPDRVGVASHQVIVRLLP